MLDINWETKEKRELVETVLSLQNKDEVERFLRDLMTKKEINEFSNRLEAAQMLSRNAQYNAIIEKTGLSSTTIARIQKWLKGPLGGYRLVFNKLNPARNASSIANAGGHTHSQNSVEKGLFLNS